MTGLVLYHFGGAICAQKVRLALAEKGLDWESRIVFDQLRSPDYLRLNPAGVVPTLTHGERVFTESRIISEYLEDAFPDPPLLSGEPAARYRARLWSKMVDDSLHINIFILSFAIAMRPRFLAMPDDLRVQNLPGLTDPIKRAITLDLLDQGPASAHLATALARFRKLIATMEAQLAETPWLAGESYSLADADLTPYVARIEELGLAALWREAPAVIAWIARVRARPSYRTAMLDWRTPADEAGFAASAETVRASGLLA